MEPAETATPEPIEELVNRMVTVGEWPDPALLEAIRDRGAEAVEPLLEVVRREATEWPETAPNWTAAGLLCDIADARALPELVNMYRRFDDDSIEIHADSIGQLGPAVIEPLLEIVRDASLRWYPRRWPFMPPRARPETILRSEDGSPRFCASCSRANSTGRTTRNTRRIITR